MKILLTGGGSGGHFYPLIAVAREIVKMARNKHMLDPKIIYAADTPYDKKILFEENIKFLKLPAGKLRRYFSLRNFIDPFKTIFGTILAIIKIYLEMPDIIFSKGGYASMPALIAARILKIPLIIHESDSVPGKANMFAKSFASRIAISFPESLKYFPENKTALTGNPIRAAVVGGNFLEAKEIFHLEISAEEKIYPPTILIIGSSQGAKIINDITLRALPELIKNFQVIHQCGANNFDETWKIATVVLKDSENKGRYHLFDFLNESQYRNASYAASIVVSRASAGAIFEIAVWGKPSILIPIIDSAQDHQRENAWNYASSHAAIVIEESNFTPHILLSEIKNILSDKERVKKMSEAARKFSKPEAANTIAEEIINLALEHIE